MATKQRLDKPETLTEITTYADYKDRIISTAIDLVLMVPIWFACQALLQHSFKGPDVPEDMKLAMPEMVPGFIAVFYCLFYMPIMDATGGTIGKRIMHIECVDATTLGKAHFMNHFGRGGILLVLCALLVFPAVLSFATMFFTDKKQTIHDIIANIIVVKKKRI